MKFSASVYKITLLVFLCGIINSRVYSKNHGNLTAADETSLVNSFFKELYNFSFHGADSVFAVMRTTDMDRAVLFNLEANLEWWRLLSGDSVGSNIRDCNDDLDESVKLLLTRNRDEAPTLLNLIYTYSLKARLENYNGNTLKAFLYFYKSSIYIKKCIARQYKDEKVYLVTGLYLYFIDYIENQNIMLNALLITIPQGDKIKGLKYLEECSSSQDEMIRTETNYFLLKIYANIEKDYPKAYEYASLLTGLYPKNMIYNLEKLKILYLSGRYEEATALQKFLIEDLKKDNNLNNEQKVHFISQIEVLRNTGI